jgi:hypothetical protein
MHVHSTKTSLDRSSNNSYYILLTVDWQHRASAKHYGMQGQEERYTV